eukprot:10333689-Alexandrium_andersonii.AAC.1
MDPTCCMLHDGRPTPWAGAWHVEARARVTIVGGCQSLPCDRGPLEEQELHGRQPPGASITLRP